MKFSELALLSAATLVAAQPHAHNHAHRHPARHGSPVEARDGLVVTETAPAPVVTVFKLDGKDIPASEVEKGLADGLYVLVGGELSTAAPTTSVAPAASSTPAPSTSEAAKFFQEPSSSSSVEVPSPTSSSTYVAPTTSSTPAPTPSTSSSSAPAAASSSSSSSSSGTGNVNANFESGKHSCSNFPSDYGAVYADWLDLGGWTGFQSISDYTFGVTDAILTSMTISTPTTGGCSENTFCSYSCPAGYQKSQWPSTQGPTGQSIGGLWCGSDGNLYLTNSDVSQLCIAGEGGVQVQNNLDQSVCICRTDYPGSESETILTEVAPSGTQPLTNPNQASYYQWKPNAESTGLPTSAQYYINNAGLDPKEACTWNTPSSDAGNWAPLNAGVGYSDGTTYISLFPNTPTNPDGKLNFNVKITGASGSCSYSNGVYTGDNGVTSASGCTVGVPSGQTATFEFSSS